MPNAWHKVMEPVHHTHPRCGVGQQATGIYQRAGTGGKPLCTECADLIQTDSDAEESESLGNCDSLDE